VYTDAPIQRTPGKMIGITHCRILALLVEPRVVASDAATDAAVREVLRCPVVAGADNPILDYKNGRHRGSKAIRAALNRVCHAHVVAIPLNLLSSIDCHGALIGNGWRGP